jgi:outer membrane protein TolC
MLLGSKRFVGIIGIIGGIIGAAHWFAVSPGAAQEGTAASDSARAPSAEAAAAAPAAEPWSLARCIATALERNGEIKGARARTVQSRGVALSAWSNVLPSISADAQFVRVIPDKGSSFRATDVNGTTYSGFATQQDFSSIAGGVQTNIVSLPAWSEKRRQDHLRSSAEIQEAETRNDVVFRVKQQYFALLKADRLAEVARESERLARDEESRSEALFQVGTVARGDVLKARARRATTQLDRIRAENQVKIQTERLKQILGLQPGTPIAVVAILDEAVAIPDSGASIQAALKARPRLESAAAAERAARSGLWGAKSQRLPSLTGSLNVERTRIQEQQDLVGLPAEFEEERYATQWSGQLRVSVPLFDGLAIEGETKRARGSLLEAEASRRQLELDVTVEVQQAWLALREAAERISVSREGLASAEEDYKFSKGRYDLGAGTFLELLNAEVGLAQARQSLVEALADARVAEADLERAIGERRY